jgi:hypothetical protein
MVYKGTVHGNIIELEKSPNLPDGQRVTVVLEATDERSSLKPGDGLRRSFGAWNDQTDELDPFLERTRGQRKQGRRELDEVEEKLAEGLASGSLGEMTDEDWEGIKREVERRVAERRA